MINLSSLLQEEVEPLTEQLSPDKSAGIAGPKFIILDFFTPGPW
jgi:hypothetical protein